MKTEHLKKIKRVKYNQKIEEIFDIKKNAWTNDFD